MTLVALSWAFRVRELRNTNDSDVRGHGHAAGNVSTFFNSKSGKCVARRLSAVSVAKNHPKVFRYADSN